MHIQHQDLLDARSIGVTLDVTLDVDSNDSSLRLISSTDGTIFGTLGEADSIVLASIAKVPTMVVQAILPQVVTSGTTLMNAIIYGPLNEYREIGTYLTEQDRFLQEPRGCTRNVKYRNPHRLTGLNEEASMTFEAQQAIDHRKKTILSFDKPLDVLDGFESRQAIPEAQTPSVIKTLLYR